MNTTPDGMGGTTETPNKVDDMWGNINPVTGNERWDVESLKGVISHTVRIRYYEGITSENWFEYKGEKYYVKYPLNEGMENTYMKIAVTSEQHAES